MKKALLLILLFAAKPGSREARSARAAFVALPATTGAGAGAGGELCRSVGRGRRERRPAAAHDRLGDERGCRDEDREASEPPLRIVRNSMNEDRRNGEGNSGSDAGTYIKSWATSSPLFKPTPPSSPSSSAPSSAVTAAKPAGGVGAGMSLLPMVAMACDEFKDWTTRTVDRNLQGTKYEFDRRQWSTSVRKWWIRSLEADEAARLEFAKMYGKGFLPERTLEETESGSVSFVAEEDWDNIYCETPSEITSSTLRSKEFPGLSRTLASKGNREGDEQALVSAAHGVAGSAAADTSFSSEEDDAAVEENEGGVIDHAINGEWSYDGAVPNFKARP
jgi:hypothetical protein